MKPWLYIVTMTFMGVVFWGGFHTDYHNTTMQYDHLFWKTFCDEYTSVQFDIIDSTNNNVDSLEKLGYQQFK